MDSRGRSQREAVNVIFKLLEALVDGNDDLAGKLLEKAQALDVAGVNLGLLDAISGYMRSNGSLEAKRLLEQRVASTPYEVAARPLFDDDGRPVRDKRPLN
ncbi:MAG: hypothetical protein EPN30_03415 [Actinomycetota bacterium]|nr:MAG: hypothetical protein EPN30_03415 [Actinomycetota bacterium]